MSTFHTSPLAGIALPGWEHPHAAPAPRPARHCGSRRAAAARKRPLTVRGVLRTAVIGILVAGSFSAATGAARWYGTQVLRERVSEAPFVLDDVTPRGPQANARVR